MPARDRPVRGARNRREIFIIVRSCTLVFTIRYFQRAYFTLNILIIDACEEGNFFRSFNTRKLNVYKINERLYIRRLYCMFRGFYSMYVTRKKSDKIKNRLRTSLSAPRPAPTANILPTPAFLPRRSKFFSQYRKFTKNRIRAYCKKLRVIIISHFRME
jgi:hypothetical protein